MNIIEKIIYNYSDEIKVTNESNIDVTFEDSKQMKSKKISLFIIVLLAYGYFLFEILSSFSGTIGIIEIIGLAIFLIAIVIMFFVTYHWIAKLMFPYNDSIIIKKISNYSNESKSYEIIMEVNLVYDKESENIIDLSKLSSLNKNEINYIKTRMLEISERIKTSFWFSLKPSFTSVIATFLSFFIALSLKFTDRNVQVEDIQYIFNVGFITILLLIVLQVISFILGYRERKKFLVLNEVISKIDTE
ncbi:hypothetical protein MF669_000908 [Clostridium perfringens]|nr:hypothetical protein [Clostridium perfringens]